MLVNQDEFISKFYSDFLMLKAESIILKRVFISFMADTDPDKKAIIEALVSEATIQFYDQLALQSPLGEQFLDDLSKGLLEQLRDQLKG